MGDTDAAPNTTLTGVSRTRAPALPRQARQLWLERANTQARIALVLLAHLGDIDLELDVVPLALAVAPEHEGDESPAPDAGPGVRRTSPRVRRTSTGEVLYSAAWLSDAK